MPWSSRVRLPVLTSAASFQDRENSALTQENRRLTSEVSRLQDELRQTKLATSDRSQDVRSKLTGVLQRLDELEQIGL